jgi:SAM-dependent methyltransferase
VSSADDGTAYAARVCECCDTPMHDVALGADERLSRCPRCRHVVRDVSRSAGVRTHAWGGRAALDRWRLALTWRRLRPLLHGHRPLDVLELGFGQGRTLRRVLDAGHRASGVDPDLLGTDIDPVVAARARLHRAEAEAVEHERQSLDLVYAIHVIEHLRDPRRVFAGVRHALRPGGTFYCLTPNADSHGLALYGRHWWNLEDPTHHRFFSPESVARLLRDVGFRRVTARRVVEDSVTLEASSLLRACARPRGGEGALRTRRGAALVLAATLVTMPLRLAWPPLAPTMEVIAVA